MYNMRNIYRALDTLITVELREKQATFKVEKWKNFFRVLYKKTSV